MKHLFFSSMLGLTLALLIGCAPKTSLTVQRPAEIDTSQIRNVAVGSFQVETLRSWVTHEREGRWESQQMALTPAQQATVARAVRAQVINLLTETPYFQVVFTDEFTALESDEALQQLVSAEGYTPQGVDAVLNGRIWLEVQRTDGVDLSKESLDYFLPPRRNGVGGMNLSIEEVIWWPYKAVHGSLALELKLTQLAPTRVVASTLDSRTYAHRIGGSPAGFLEGAAQGLQQFAAMSASSPEPETLGLPDEVLPSFDQVVADLASSIAAQFVKRVAVTRTQVPTRLAAGGDETAKVLMQSEAWNTAIERLQQITASNANLDDLYHLGLCFEAIGDYGIARNFYRDAWRQDQENLMYAQALGRLERLQREFPQLRQQLQSR
jgi:tetratricopeptide (TPR) repeat protein